MSFGTCGNKVGASSGVKFVPSMVDDTLFGEPRKARKPVAVPDFEPPWAESGSTKPNPLLFYCPTTPSRPSSFSSRTSSASRGPQPKRFSPSYVDDSLFGKRRTKLSDSPPSSEFDPPWVKESDKKKVRPILFDCSSRIVFDNTFGTENRSSRTSETPRSSSQLRKGTQRFGSTPRVKSCLDSRKPPWR